MAVSRPPSRSTEREPLTPERRHELRRRAERLRAGSPAAQAAGRAISFLLDEIERLESPAGPDLESALDPRRRAELRRLHERLAAGPEGARSAARAIATLVGEVARLEEAAVAAPDGVVDDEEAAERGRERRRAARERRRGPRRDDAPVRLAVLRPSLPRLRRPSLRIGALPRPSRRAIVAAAAVPLLVAAAFVASRIAAPDIRASGPESPLVGAAAATTLSFSVEGDPDVVRRARWSVDGKAPKEGWVRVEGGRSTLVGLALPDGEHTIEVAVAGPVVGTAAERSWEIEIDRTPPRIAVDRKSARATPGRPATLTGTVEDGLRVSALDEEADVRDRRFRLELPAAPTVPFQLAAVDRFGNTARARVRLTLVPRRPRSPIRSVHMTFHSWANEDLRRAVLQMVDEGRINSVELDLKDESGIVGFDAAVPLGREIGAVEEIYDLRKAIDLLHSKGVWVIGRVVAFRDPVHAPAAWKRGWRDQVIQTPSGEPYAGYGGFTNFANPKVRQYNIDVARRAAEAGIDDILYDYVRRPDGPRSSMRFPGLRTTPERSIASFLAEARRHLAPYDTFLGASVFGVAASRPEEIAQHIPSMARNVDYIAPMVYPSHWGPGEYEVPNPNAQPYDIVRRSLADFQKRVKGTGARVVPWLQDFSYGVTYGPAEVRAQIEAAEDVGIDEWILWDAEVTYTAAALDRHKREPPIETVRHEPKPPLPPGRAKPN